MSMIAPVDGAGTVNQSRGTSLTMHSEGLIWAAMDIVSDPAPGNVKVPV
jgi:hypothetical protein